MIDAFNMKVLFWPQNATMSLAPLSVNSERENVMDFTRPYKTRGVTVLIKTPDHQTSYFVFMKPFSYTGKFNSVDILFIYTIIRSTAQNNIYADVLLFLFF